MGRQRLMWIRARGIPFLPVTTLVKPQPSDKDESTHSKCDHVGKLQLPTLSRVLDPEFTAAELLARCTRSCLSRIFIASPRFHTEAAWSPVKNNLICVTN